MKLRLNKPYQAHPERSPLEQLLTYFPRVCNSLCLSIDYSFSIPIKDLKSLALHPYTPTSKKAAELLLCIRSGLDSIPSTYQLKSKVNLKKPLNPREIIKQYFFYRVPLKTLAREYGYNSCSFSKLINKNAELFKAGFNSAVKSQGFNSEYLI